MHNQGRQCASFWSVIYIILRLNWFKCIFSHTCMLAIPAKSFSAYNLLKKGSNHQSIRKKTIFYYKYKLLNCCIYPLHFDRLHHIRWNNRSKGLQDQKEKYNQSWSYVLRLFYCLQILCTFWLFWDFENYKIYKRNSNTRPYEIHNILMM